MESFFKSLPPSASSFCCHPAIPHMCQPKMPRMKPVWDQDQTKSEAVSECQHKGEGNNLLIENSFQKETRDDAQEGKSIPRINIKKISYHMCGVCLLVRGWWGGGERERENIRVCACARVHKQK